MKTYIKEVLRDGALLLGLIVLPIAFIGPNGFASKLGHGQPAQQQPKNESTGPSFGQETKAEPKQPDRFIPLLHAFKKPGEER